MGNIEKTNQNQVEAVYANVIQKYVKIKSITRAKE